YPAEDADSEGEEGKFYLWTPGEIEAALGEEDSRFFMEIYHIRPGGNLDQNAGDRQPDGNIPHLEASPSELASRFGLSEGELTNKLEDLRQRLFTVREKRVHPLKDDKILTDWNGLMIAAMAKGAQVLGEKRYADAAAQAAHFVLNNLRTPEGHLIKRYRDGVASLPAHIEDYAFMVWGLLELYEATFQVTYLQHAVDLTGTMIDQFWDDANGAFFFTSDDGEKLIVRTKELYDGAIPSGNSIAALDLYRIGRITGNPEMEAKAATIGRVFSSQVDQSPSSFSQLLSAVDFGLGPSYEIVVVGDPDGEDTQTMLALIQKEYLPNKVVLLKPTDENSRAIVALAPFTETQTAMDGKATAYVCQNYACKAPTTSPDEMLAALK
ncbi:MAG: thioredoxin domain-containing protein, partial [Fidelibacterota bacterium]